MNTFLRTVSEYRALWRVWLPLPILAVITPLLALATPLVEKQLIDGVLLPGRLNLLPSLLGLYAALWVATTAAQVSGGVAGTYVSQRLTQHLQQRLFAKYSSLSLAFSHREHSGQVLSLFSNDVPGVLSLFTSTGIGALGSIVTIIVGAAAMLTLNWQLALVAGIVPPIVAVASSRLTRPLRPASRRVQEKTAELVERLQENLVGLREVVAFGQEAVQAARFSSALDELVRLRMRIAMIDRSIQTGQSVFSLAVNLAMLGVGGYLVITGQTTLGTLIAMRSLFSYVFVPANQMLGLVSGAQKSIAAADRVYAFLDEVPRVQECAQPRQPQLAEGEIVFQDVSFAYTAERPVLHDVSLKVEPGELLALVGPSGAGKSTLASLLLRFYDPSDGRVLLDGIDLRELSLADLRSQIGVVFQDTFLFASSIRANIALGRSDATEEDIIAAAKSANAWEFIEQMPEGLDTEVGERGVRLSEGQKQRLALARAFLRNPRILILDEPTSALDARSEQLLQSALSKLIRGRTTIVIAHRLATIRRADRIAVLEHGRVVEHGKHDELLAQGGLYHELCELQFGGARFSTPDASRSVRNGHLSLVSAGAD